MFEIGNRVWLQRISVVSDLRQVEPEVRLWRAVIDQTITDFLYPDGLPMRRQSAVWLRGKTEDFKEVCSNAGLEPSIVKKFIHHAVGGEDKLYE